MINVRKLLQSSKQTPILRQTDAPEFIQVWRGWDCKRTEPYAPERRWINKTPLYKLIVKRT